MAKKTAAAAAAKTENLPAVIGKSESGLALVDTTSYALVNSPNRLAAMVFNLKDEQLSEFDLDRVKVPAGGGTAFQLPTPEGIKNSDELVGIVLHFGQRRSYWSDPNPTGVPPSCYSIDGLVGIGDRDLGPGDSGRHDCSTCPHNQFGSAVKIEKGEAKQGKGKRCREMRVMLILREIDTLPIVVLAPPTSIKPLKKWLMELPVFMYRAVIRLTLEQDKADNIVYSKLVPECVGEISEEAGKALEAYAATLGKVLRGKAPTASDFHDAGEPQSNDVNGSIDQLQEPEEGEVAE